MEIKFEYRDNSWKKKILMLKCFKVHFRKWQIIVMQLFHKVLTSIQKLILIYFSIATDIGKITEYYKTAV